MNTKNKYRKTLIACYTGFITQAISANFAPLLYLTFHRDYGLSFSKLALISTVFFVTQIVVDFVCAKFVDGFGYRRSVVLSSLTSTFGLAGLAFLPDLMPTPFSGILLCTFIYAIGSGLTEVLVSPIVEACPFDHKEQVMSLLHSFYCWGSVGVILGSTLYFRLFGTAHWRTLAVIWSLVPLWNIFNFATCPIERLVEEGEGMTIGQLLKNKVFWLLIVLMVCAGSSELAMGQWASAFAESALHVSKTVGDLAGPCGFAVFMGLSRVLYSKTDEKTDLTGYMMLCGILCVICYLLAAFAKMPIFGLIGCTVCGFSVGIMWPGSLSISSKILPAGGTAMFALLALAGDLGGSLGPAIVGTVSQSAGENIRAGLLAGIGFPAVLAITVFFLRRMKRAEK